MKKIMSTMMMKTMTFRKDTRGSLSIEHLVWAIIIIVCAGLIMGVLNGWIPEFGSLLMNKVKGIFNL